MTINETQTVPAPTIEAETAESLVGPWKVVVLNDPVNLMSYVVLVFRKVFGFDENRAREKAEHFAFILHQWHLTAVLERNETD